jgi:hypothetical protein
MSVPIYNHFEEDFVASAVPADWTKKCQISNTGEVKQLTLVVPNFSNAVTATLNIRDENGFLLYTTTAQARNTNQVFAGLDFCVSAGADGTSTVEVVLSGNPGGTSTWKVLSNIFMKV